MLPNSIITIELMVIKWSHGELQNTYKVVLMVGNLKGHFGDAGTDGRIVQIRLLNKYAVKAWNGFELLL
jgi:hypothetical protein